MPAETGLMSKEGTPDQAWERRMEPPGGTLGLM